MAEEEAKAPEENAEATQPAEAGAEAAAEAPVEAPPPPNMMVPMIASVIISLGGMFAIFKFVIPGIIEKSVKDAVADANSTDGNKTAKASKEESKDDGKKGEASGGDGKDESAGPIPIVGEDENIIVNPAGSGGTRYLLVEIYLERLKDNDTGFKPAIEAKSKELQAVTINQLRRYNAEDLSDPVTQDTIRDRLKKMYQEILGANHLIDKLTVTKWIMQ